MSYIGIIIVSFKCMFGKYVIFIIVVGDIVSIFKIIFGIKLKVYFRVGFE